MEGGASFNALNFNVRNTTRPTGMNFTGARTVVSCLPLPLGDPPARRRRDGVDPNDPFSADRQRLRLHRLRPDRLHRHQPDWRHRPPGSSPATPYRDKATRADGLLKQGKTRIAEITDGTSNTIAIGEDAGRDPRFLSPYTEGYWDGGSPARQPWPDPATTQGPAGGYTPLAPLLAMGRARRRPSASPARRTTSSARCTRSASGPARLRRHQGNNAGANDELFSFHPGGVNVLFGDGSVRFLKDTINLVTLRALVTLKGGEVVSADQY